MGKRASQTDWKSWLDGLRDKAPAASIDRPFRVIAERRETIRAGQRRLGVRCYDLRVPYLDIRGQPRAGLARLYIPARARAPLPLVVNLHYELGVAGMITYLQHGWACLSAAQGLNPFCDSINFNLALVQAGRAMPAVDGTRIGLVGGSAGGYVTMMVASQAFPIAAIAPAVPIVNGAYNVAHFARNARPAGCRRGPPQGAGESAVPVFCAVADMVAQAGRPLGDTDRQAANWIANSPVGVVRLITCPAQVFFSTADVLVPINQVGPGLAYPTPESFPPRFTFEMGGLLRSQAGRVTLLKALGRGRYRLFRDRLPPQVPEIAALPSPPPPAEHTLAPRFGGAATFCITVVDEGPPEPRVGHFKHHLTYTNTPFFASWLGRERPILEQQLTTAKLAVLMRRFRGEHFEGVMRYGGGSRRPSPMNRRNRPGKERLDVILGLRAYAQLGERYRARLRRIYARLPAGLRALDVAGAGITARLGDDVMGGLTFHEAMLHYRWGDRHRAAALARDLMRSPIHAAYAACLPRTLARYAAK